MKEFLRRFAAWCGFFRCPLCEEKGGNGRNEICPECRGEPGKTGQCRKCGRTGYKGRSGIFELLLVNDEFRSAVNRRADSTELEAIAVKHGMVTLLQDAEAKIRAGITTEDEVRRSTADNG